MHMKLTKTHPLFMQFLSLSCALSPENLTCDGECSRKEVNTRYNKLAKQWAELETKFGGRVSEKDVWDAEFSN